MACSGRSGKKIEALVIESSGIESLNHRIIESLSLTTVILVGDQWLVGKAFNDSMIDDSMIQFLMTR
jgi:hypothetical protein